MDRIVRAAPLSFLIFACLSGGEATAEGGLGPPLVRISGAQIVLIQPIEFQTGAAELSPESEPVLERLRQLLTSTPTIGSVRVDYHADCIGQRQAVEALANRRAERVRRWLIERGIAPERVEARAVVPERATPGSPCSAPRRHVEIWITG